MTINRFIDLDYCLQRNPISGLPGCGVKSLEATSHEIKRKQVQIDSGSAIIWPIAL
jgi:hypothetical protein